MKSGSDKHMHSRVSLLHMACEYTSVPFLQSTYVASHVTALLFKIEAASRLGYNYTLYHMGHKPLILYLVFLYSTHLGTKKHFYSCFYNTSTFHTFNAFYNYKMTNTIVIYSLMTVLYDAFR